MGALFIWAPPAGSDGDGADVEPGHVNDFADAAGEDHLAKRESEPASVLLADVAGHVKARPCGRSAAGLRRPVHATFLDERGEAHAQVTAQLRPQPGSQSDCRYRARTAVRLAAGGNKPWLV